MNKETEKRKAEHVRIVLNEKVEGFKGNGFDEMEFEHYSLPEMDYREVNAATTFLGKKLKAPLMVTGMTGGYQNAERINNDLAAACEEKGVAFGLGSQRAMLEDASLAKTFKVRKSAPSIFIAANIGAVQLKQYPLKKVREMVEAIGADALAVHLNPLQEAVQREGDKDWRGCLEAIEKACDELSVPVIAKETGAGINYEVAMQLKEAGVKALDTSGAGGTSWSAIEVYRKGAEAGRVFSGWGITTAESVMDCVKAKLPVIASGGMRNGLQAAKAIRLGAALAGAANPFIKAQSAAGMQGVSNEIDKFTDELKIAMFLTRSKNLQQLRKAKLRKN